MQVTASAPGKAILFGEHSVVYGKPAIAMALNKRTHVEVTKGNDANTQINVRSLGIKGAIDLKNDRIISKSSKKGILKYVLNSIKKVHDQNALNISINTDVPIGGGLGSSAAVTVALIAAVSKYNDADLKKKEIAKLSHEVELEVQHAASPLDTTISTYGGLIYLKKGGKDIISLNAESDIPIVIGYTDFRADTGKLIEKVKNRKNRYPEIMDFLIDSIESITNEAKESILNNNEKRIGELMNINHGLLDALGVNTLELSNMVYKARDAGALGSKITGAGGGGSIIAYCPDKSDEVESALLKVENAFKANISKEGVVTCIKEVE